MSVQRLSIPAEPSTAADLHPVEEPVAVTVDTWCRTCGARIPVEPGAKRPDFCSARCRLRNAWRGAPWRL